MSTADLGKRTLAAVNWGYAGAVLRILSQLVVQLLLARLLGPEAFGQATAALFVLAVGWMVADGGFGSALIHRENLTDADVGYALGWMLAISGLIAGVGVLGARLIADLLGSPALAPLVMACAALIPLQALSNLPMSLMRRQLDMKRMQLLQLSGYVLGYGGVGLLFAYEGWGAWSLVVGYAAQSIIALVGSYACVRHTLRPRLRGDRQLFRFGLNVMGTNIANWAIDNLDRMVVSRQWGAASLGEYTAAANLSRSPASFMVSSMQSVLFASASRVQTEPERLARGFMAVLGFVSLLSFPLFAYLALHADLLVHTLYGHKWEHAAPLFAAFCVAIPFYTMLAVTGPMLWAVGAVGAELKIQVLTGACVLAGFWALSGFALASVVWIVPAIYAGRVLLVYLALSARVPLPTAGTARALLGGLFCAAVTILVYVVVERVMGESWLAAIAGAVATIVLCLAMLRVAGSALLAPALVALLRTRAAESRPVSVVASILGLR